MKKLLVLAVTGLAVLIAAAPPLAAKGGWAESALDRLPKLEAGVPVAVGFTVLQHGTKPADHLEDVAITIFAGKSSNRFPATAEGAPGHYVATVVFPASGTFEWRTHQGWFNDFELEPVSVAGSTSLAGWVAEGSVWPSADMPLPAVAGDGSWPWSARLSVTALAVAFLTLIVFEVRGRLRSRRPKFDPEPDPTAAQWA